MLTSQELFNKVVEHATKGEKAVDAFSSGCMYRVRTNTGCKRCFIGALIPDELYSTSMEGVPAGFLLTKLRLVATNSTTEKLANNLQTVHDAYDVKDWGTQLRLVATKFALVINPEHIALIDKLT